MIDVNSDFHPRYENSLKIAVGRHDICVISVYDPREFTIPDVGLIRVKDQESGKEMWIDSSSKKVREYYSSWSNSVREKRDIVLKRYKVDSVSIATNQDYIKGLVSLFKNR
jgi:hypothetical protein